MLVVVRSIAILSYESDHDSQSHDLCVCWSYVRENSELSMSLYQVATVGPVPAFTTPRLPKSKNEVTSGPGEGIIGS